MVANEDKSTAQLRQEYESNSKRYIIFSVVLRVLTFVGVIIAVFLILQNQLQIKNQVMESQRQSITNQKYIRCIVLLPAETYRNNPAERAKAVDQCAVKSRLPR